MHLLERQARGTFLAGDVRFCRWLGLEGRRRQGRQTFHGFRSSQSARTDAPIALRLCAKQTGNLFVRSCVVPVPSELNSWRRRRGFSRNFDRREGPVGLTWHRVRGIAWLSIRVKIGEQKCMGFSSVHMSREDICHRSEKRAASVTGELNCSSSMELLRSKRKSCRERTVCRFRIQQ